MIRDATSFKPRELAPCPYQRSVIDLVFGFLILLMTYALSSEGLWGAALMFFNVLFGGLIAFNFYEPLARLIDSTGIGWGFSDTLSLLSTLLRLACCSCA